MEFLTILPKLIAVYAGIGVLIWIQATRDYNDMLDEERLFYYGHSGYNLGFVLGNLFVCMIAWPWSGKGE